MPPDVRLQFTETQQVHRPTNKAVWRTSCVLPFDTLCCHHHQLN